MSQPDPLPRHTPFQQERSRRTAERIVAAALGLLSARRIEEISVADIAGEAGVSVGGFYARFASKDALFAYLNGNVLEEIVAHARELFSEEATRDLGARELISRYVLMAVDGFRKHRLILQQIALRSRTSQDESFRKHVLALNVELHDLFRLRLAEHFDEVAHPHPERALDLALTAVSAVMREYILFGEFRPQFEPIPDSSLAGELIDLFHTYLRIES